MKEIIVGTDRKGSRSRTVSEFIQGLYAKAGEEVGIIDISEVGLSDIKKPYTDERPDALHQAIERVNNADGLIFVVPEYNGSYPGALKYLIDHWAYPTSFEFRPVCYVGLGGRWGGLRPIEHLQGVMGYRNAYQLPQRVFLSGIFTMLNEAGEITQADVLELLEIQVKEFQSFVKGLNSVGLAAPNRNQ